MLTEFKRHLDNHFCFLQNETVLIAVSGGIDSVVLVHLYHQLGLDFELAHCNFKLRGEESDGDEAFVIELAKGLNRKVITTSFDTESYASEHKKSIQVAARELRYQWFHEILSQKQLQYVLTAHNTNDNLETFIINLTRGSGLEGFTGIPPINGSIVRPLLEFSRDDIMMFAIKNHIEWREDRSNASIKYVRNKVRHKILPVLQDINPNILDSFKNTLQYLNESQDIIDTETKRVSEHVMVTDKNCIFKLDIAQLTALPNPKAYLYQLLKDYGFSEWEDITNLLSTQSGKQVFSKDYRLLKDRNFLLLTRIDKASLDETSYSIAEGTESIAHPIPMHFETGVLEGAVSAKSIWVDKDLLNFPLHVRKWRHGDYICPTGMKGSKKLSQLFKDRKLSLIDKENTWLLVDALDTIIWVVGMRQDRRFSVTEQTKTIVKITTS